jgi:hypothetical protein
MALRTGWQNPRTLWCADFVQRRSKGWEVAARRQRVERGVPEALEDVWFRVGQKISKPNAGIANKVERPIRQAHRLAQGLELVETAQGPEPARGLSPSRSTKADAYSFHSERSEESSETKPRISQYPTSSASGTPRSTYSPSVWVSTHRTAWRMRAVASFNSSFSLMWLRCTSTVLGLR